MIYRLLLLSFLLIGTVGCGPKTVPVSVEEKTTEKSDSTSVKNTNVRSDSSYVETVTEKKLPGSEAGITLSKSQFDSLVNGLKALPPGLRTVYRTDPTLQSTIKIMMDSIGQLHFLCTTAERTYWEKTISQQKLIESLTTELFKSNNERNHLREEIKEYKRTWWDDVKGFFRTTGGILVIGLVLAIVATAIGLYKKLKPHG